MNKYFKVIIILIATLSFGYIIYSNENGVEVSQEISEGRYSLSFVVAEEEWNIGQGEGDDFEGYDSGFYFQENHGVNVIDVGYLKKNETIADEINNGDTGGSPYSDIPLPLEFSNDEVIYIGTYLEKDLYLPKNYTQDGAVYQKIGDFYYDNMPLMNISERYVKSDDNQTYYFEDIKNPTEFPLYSEQFYIRYNFYHKDKTGKDYKKDFKELIEILKSMKIEPIQE